MSKQLYKLEKNINKAKDVQTVKSLEDYASFEEFMLLQTQRDYVLNMNNKIKNGEGSESGIGMYLTKEILSKSSENVVSNMSRYIDKKARQTNISKFFMMSSTYMNISEDGVDENAVKSSVAIAIKILINTIMSEHNYFIENNSFNLSSKFVTIYNIYDKVGQAILEEQIMNSLMIQEPILFKNITRRNVDKDIFQRINKVIKSKKSINYIKKDGTDRDGNEMLIVDKKQIDNDITKIGAFFIENIINSCDIFEVKTIVEKNKKINVVSINEEFEQKILENQSYNSMLNPRYLPIPEKFGKPVRWTGLNQGGYKHIDTKFIKKSTKKQIKSKNVTDFYKTMDAANTLQNTLYGTNETVYNTIRYLLNNDIRFTTQSEKLILPFLNGRMTDEVSKLPSHLEEYKEQIKDFNKKVNEYKNKNTKKTKKGEKTVLPPRLDIEKQSKKFQKVWTEYREHQIKIRLEKEALIANRSKYLSLVEALRTVDMMDGNNFYLPTQIDYRTRFYYLPILNPQTSDSTKGLLRYGKSQRVTSKNDFYFMFNCGANDFGHDKAHPDFKRDWVLENIEKIADCGAEPIENIEFWGNADKPFMFLNFCVEINEYRKNNYEYLDSTYCCYYDGSCNGTAHFAAICGDRNAAKLTNLTESNDRHDLYTNVAVSTEKYVLDLSEGKLIIEDVEFKKDSIAHAIDILKYGVNRKLVKQNVMTMVYGATAYGRREQVESVYKEIVQNRGVLPFKQETIGIKASIVSKLALLGIRKENPGVFKVMEWLENCSVVFSDCEKIKDGEIESFGLEMNWTNSTGARVTHLCKKTKSDDIKFKANTKNIKIYREVETNTLNKEKMKNGIVPNFVHSQDASHMALTINECSKHFNDFSCVHDSFGCSVKNASKLFQIVRKTFVDMYCKRDILDNLYNDFYNQLLEHSEESAEQLPKPPEMGDYYVEESLGSVYSFI